jgi:hypothetical protein
MRTIGLSLVTLLLTACASTSAPVAPAPAGHQSGSEADVLAAMDRYMRAITAGDLEAMKAMQMQNGMTFRARIGDNGSVEVIGRPNSYWVDPARADGHRQRERYWSPTVLVRGPIAVVWAPYEYWVDDKTSHCGVDVFDFINFHGTWRVTNSMWTVEPKACDELRPSDPAAIRPAD